MNQVVQALEPEPWGDMELDDIVIALKSKMDIKKKSKMEIYYLVAVLLIHHSSLFLPTSLVQYILSLP